MITILKLTPVWLFSIIAVFLFHGLGKRGQFKHSILISWLFSATITGLVFVLIAVTADLLHMLGRPFVLTAWLLADCAIAGAAMRTLKLTPRSALEAVKTAPGRLLRLIKVWPAPNVCIAGMAGALLLIFGLFALSLPVTVWDSHTYHMPRVMHWIQQGGFAHYQTNIQRQIESAPGTEFQITELFLLSDADETANLVQWWASITCAVAAAFLALEFLKSMMLRNESAVLPGLTAATAALLTLTISDDVCQAFTSQNDLHAALWTVVAVTFGWLLLQAPQNKWYIGGMGSALALGVCTKPTVLIYLAPFGVVFLACICRRRQWKTLAETAVACAAIMIAVNAQWMVRNYRTFGHPLGSADMFASQRIAHPTPGKIAANVVRNLSLYTRTPSENVTAVLNNGVQAILNVMKQDPSDPDCIFEKLPLYRQSKAVIENGDGLGNCYILLLLTAAIIVFAVRFRIGSGVGLYVLATILGFVLFAAYLRWQPWHFRLHLAFGILAAPFIAATLASVMRPKHLVAITSFLSLNALLIACVNPNLPTLLGITGAMSREELLFAEQRNLYAPTCKLAEEIIKHGCSSVALKTGNNTWEYPLWALLRNRGFTGTIDHVLVENETRKIESKAVQGEGTVLVSSGVEMRHYPGFPQWTTYGPWNAHYRGTNEDHRVEFIENQIVMPISPRAQGVANIHCIPLSNSGARLTSGSLHVIIGTAQLDFPISPAGADIECTLPGGNSEIIITNTAGELGPFSLGQFDLRFKSTAP